MHTYSFLLKGNCRIDVKASSPIAGYKKLMAIPFIADKLDKAGIYQTYSKDGLADINDWKSLNES